MKGIIFTLFREYIETNHDLETWEEIVQQVQPVSNAAYTAVATYDDSELVDLLMSYSKSQNKDPNIVLKSFGEFLFPILAEKYSIFLTGHQSVLTFLKTVDDLIHVEVNKLYENASLPTINYHLEENAITLFYQSPRKMCALAEGLIIGAANSFNETIEIDHSTCMHRNDPQCTIRVRVK